MIYLIKKKKEARIHHNTKSPRRKQRIGHTNQNVKTATSAVSVRMRAILILSTLIRESALAQFWSFRPAVVVAAALQRREICFVLFCLDYSKSNTLFYLRKWLKMSRT